ncbi:MAG TPA: hypothetical protein VLY82_03825 [Nitrososphaerales archaeon]|nr:hypothetical protein [Nitrososphaerales archaeon]
MRNGVVAIVLAILVVGSLGVGYFVGNINQRTVTTTPTNIETSTATSTKVVATTYLSTYCTISGQPGGISVRFLNSTTLTPVNGAYVVAVNRPFLCSGGTTLTPAGPQTVTIFTTNRSEWYPLSSDSNHAYSIAAFYAGHTYNFTADLRPVSITCATLYIPSGQTNVTITTFGNTCVT